MESINRRCCAHRHPSHLPSQCVQCRVQYGILIIQRSRDLIDCPACANALTRRIVAAIERGQFKLPGSWFELMHRGLYTTGGGACRGACQGACRGHVVGVCSEPLFSSPSSWVVAATCWPAEALQSLYLKLNILNIVVKNKAKITKETN